MAAQQLALRPWRWTLSESEARPACLVVASLAAGSLQSFNTPHAGLAVMVQTSQLWYALQ